MRLRDVLFLIGTFIVTMICGPYIYYTYIVYMHIQDHAMTQAGPNFDMQPSPLDFWITLVSAIAVFTTKQWSTKAMLPLIRKISKVPTN